MSQPRHAQNYRLTCNLKLKSSNIEVVRFGCLFVAWFWLLLGCDNKTLIQAYDSVWRPLLFKKLEKLGFGGKTLKIIKSLYSNDSLKFAINGKYSREIYLTRGVKQGKYVSLQFSKDQALIYVLKLRTNSRTIRENYVYFQDAIYHHYCSLFSSMNQDGF